MHDELHRQIAQLVTDHADRATPPPVAAIRRRGRRRRARLVAVTAGVVLVLWWRARSASTGSPAG